MDPSTLYEMPRQGDLFVKIIGSGNRVEAFFARADVECNYDRKTGTVESWHFVLLWGVRNYKRIGTGERWTTMSDWHPYDPEKHADLPHAPKDVRHIGEAVLDMSEALGRALVRIRKLEEDLRATVDAAQKMDALLGEGLDRVTAISHTHAPVSEPINTTTEPPQTPTPARRTKL